MIYFEFSENLVNTELPPGVPGFPSEIPASICCFNGHAHSLKAQRFMSMANRVYSITGNKITEYKNRNGTPSTMYISDEDKLVLKLKAVLI